MIPHLIPVGHKQNGEFFRGLLKYCFKDLKIHHHKLVHRCSALFGEEIS